MPTPFRRRLLSLAVAQALALSGGALLPLAPAGATSLPTTTPQFESARDLQRTLIELKNTVLERPDDPDLRLQLGQLYLSMGDGPGAQKELERAIELGRNEYDVRLQLGNAWVLQREYQKPFTDYHLGQAATPAERAGLAALQGRVRLAEGKHAEARTLFETALREQPDLVAGMVGMVEAELAADNQGGAELALVQLEQAPDVGLGEISRLRGQIAIHRERFDEAEQAFSAALEQHPGDARLLRSVAQAQLNQGKASEAIASLERVQAVMPSDGQTMLLLAMANFEAGDHARAVQAASRLIGGPNQHPAPLYIAGASSAALGNTQQAREYLSRYVAMQPDDDDARRLYGAILLQSDAGKDAYSVLQPLRDQADDDTGLLPLLGVSAVLAGKPEVGLAYLQRAANLTPDDPDLRELLTTAQLAAGDRDAGMASLRQLAAQREDPALFQRLAKEHIAHGEFDQALVALAEVPEQSEANPNGAVLKAIAQMRQGDLGAAETTLQQALAAAPGDPNVLSALADLQFNRGNVAGARAEVETLVERHPALIEPQLTLARLDAVSGREQPAEQRLQALLRSHPNRLEARLELATLYGSAERWTEAEDVLNGAPVPDNPEVLRALGNLYLSMERPGRAVDALQRAVAADPRSIPARLQLVRALQTVGDIGAAADAIDAAAEMAPEDLRVRYERARLAVTDLAAKPERLSVAGEDILAVQRDPAYGADAATLTGLWVMRDGDTERGLDYLRAAHEALRTSDSLRLYTDALWAVGRRRTAMDTIDRWVTAHPRDTRALLNRGHYWLTESDYARAAADWQQARDLGAEHAWLDAMLAYVLVNAGNARAAAPLAQAAHEADRSDAMALHALGLVRLREGNAPAASDLLTRAVERSGQPSAALRLDQAEALAATGQPTDARRIVEQVLTELPTGSALQDRARSLLSR